MANINSVITYNANLSPAQAQIKALTGQITALSTAFNTLDKSALSAQRSLAATFATGVGQIGGFTAKTIQAHNAVENFGKQIAANRLTMRESFREAVAGYTKQNSLMKQLAQQQVRYQQSVSVPMGGGQMMMLTPTSIAATGNSAAMAAQKFSIFNQLIDNGATSMLNWGKNTQWAGRQLMVGFSIPLAMFTALASKQFRDLDKELTRFQKVYGSDLGGAISESTTRMREQIQQLAYEISRTYGIAAKDTAALAADIAATGAEGEDLINSVQQTTRLAVLGEVDRQEAMKATLALQSAFRLNTDELAESINFLNAVENQTSATLQDLSTAIPKVGPVVRSLGGDVKDLATLLVAMREGGIPAAEAANALKSGLASLINPTKQASEVAKKFGIDLVGIVDANKGQLMPTIYAMKNALDGLDEFGKSRVIEQIFGKYQFARISALFDNIGRTGSQTQSVIELAAKSSTDLAAVANQEIKTLTESTAVKFQRTLEDLKNAIMPIGQALTETLIPILSFIGEGIQKFSGFFQDLPGPIKNFAKLGVAIAALAGPIIMLVGLFGNLIANGLKFGMMVTRLGARMSGLKVERFELLNSEVMAAKFGVDNLTASFTTQETAMKRLVGVMSAYETSLRKLSTSNPALFVPGVAPAPRGAVPIRRQAGSTRPEFVPGSGRGDKIPAMLEPGEFIVNRAATEKYAPVLMQMNRGTLKGYENGGGTSRLAHLTRSVTVPITSAMDSATSGARRVLQQMLADGITEVKLFNNLVVSLSKATNDALNTEVEGKGVKKSILAAELKDRERWSLMMKATGLSFDQLQPTITGITSAMARLEGELINDPQLYRLVEAELVKLSNAGDIAAQRLLALSKQYGTVEYLRTNEGKERPGRMALGVSTSGTGTYKGSRLAADSWARKSTVDLERALDEGVVRAIQSSSPSKKADSIGEKAGKNIGNGAIIGLERGLRIATSKQVRTGPIGPGLESRSTATVYQREENARKLLEKALIKETQQTGLIADTKQRIVVQQKQHNIVLANWTKDLETGRWVHKDGTVAGTKRAAALDKLAQEESLLAAEEKKLRDIISIRERAERNAANAAESKAIAEKQLNQSIVKRSVQEGTMFTPGSYLMGGVSPYAASGANRPSRFGDISMDQRKALAAQRREAYLNNVGPGKSLTDARESGGMRGAGAMNAAMGASMLASTVTMFSGATSEASSKIMMFTTALTTAIFALQAFSGTGIGGGIVGGVKKMGGGMAGLGARATAAAAGRGALTAGLLGGGGKALTGIGGALAGGGAAAAGTVAAVAIPLVITAAGLYMYKKSLDEAKEKANAAFAEPAKTAEFFGKTIDSLGSALENIQAAGASKELSSINSELRMAVSEDYAGLIEKLKTSITTVGAADLGSAYTKMIISGMSAEEAQDAIKAIAAEAGYKGGLAFASAFSNGLLEAKTIEEAYQQTIGNISPESVAAQQTAISEARKQQIMADPGQYGIGTPKAQVASLNFPNNVLAGGPEFVQALKSSIEISQTAPELVAQNLDKLRESYLALNEDADDILGMGTAAREMAFDEFKNMMGELDDPVINKLLDQLQDSTAETQVLAIQMTALGVPLTEAKNATGQFDDALARAAIENASRLATLNAVLDDTKQALLDFADSSPITIAMDDISESVDKMQDKIESYAKSREKEKESIQENFELEQKAREDSLEAMQDEMDIKKESFDEEMDQLDEKSDKIEKSSDAYIKSLQKNQKADSFYSQQRKTAFGALQKLASGDVFGFLQDREQMSQDAQQFSYDEQISGIEERRDLELEAIDETRSEKQKEQEEYEKMMQDRMDSIQDLMDKESEMHETNMKNYDDETEKHNEELERRLQNRSSKNQEAKDIIDGIKNGEIESYKQVTKVFGEQLAKRYADLVKNQIASLDAVLKQQVAAGDIERLDAEKQLVQMYNDLFGAAYFGGTPTSNSGYGGVGSYEDLRGKLGLSSFLSPIPKKNLPELAYGGHISGPGGPKSDVIPAMLSNGEYVVQASSVSKYGKDMMDTINAGKFAEGGLVLKPIEIAPVPEKVLYPEGTEAFKKLGKIQKAYKNNLINKKQYEKLTSFIKENANRQGNLTRNETFDFKNKFNRFTGKDSKSPVLNIEPILEIEPIEIEPILEIEPIEIEPVGKYADGGPVELKKSLDKWMPKNRLSYYSSWDQYGAWPGGKPSGIMMHHTAGVGPGVLEWMARNPEAGKPVVQAMVGRDATAHILAYGGTGWGAGAGGTEGSYAADIFNNKEYAGLKEDLKNLGGASNTLWQIEVESQGLKKDFTAGMFDTIARMSAAIKEYAGWPSFAGKIINHKDWTAASGPNRPNGQRGDTLYPLGLYQSNADRIWEQGGGETSETNNGGSGASSVQITPSIAAPKKGLFGILSMAGTPVSDKQSNSNNNGSTNEPTGNIQFSNIPDGYTVEDANRTLGHIRAGGWPTNLQRLAWSIAMRESGGRNIYDTGDYGIFQLNKPSYGSQPWWISDDKILNDPVYNSSVAYKNVSQSGKNFLPWAMRVDNNGNYSWDWSYYNPRPTWADATETRTAAFWNSWKYKASGGIMKLSAGGGAVSGPGGPRSDMIPAMLSNGEYVVKASSVAKYGKGFMDQVNAGQFGMGGLATTAPRMVSPAKYAGGGFVGSMIAATPTFGVPQVETINPSSMNANIANSYGGSNSSSVRNSSKVNIVINGAGGKSSNAIANKVISMINQANGRRNHSRSAG